MLVNMNISVFVEHTELQNKSSFYWANIHMVQALLMFFEVFYLSKGSVAITSSCRRIESCDAFWDVMSFVFKKMSVIKIQIIRRFPNDGKHIFGPRQKNVIFVDSYKAFLDINLASYTHQSDTIESYYIILQVEDDGLETHLQYIFEYCWRHQFINCTVQTILPSGEIKLHSYFPYTLQHCNKVVPQILGEFSANLSHIFPNKLTNLYGCPLTAALYDVPPFVCLKRNKRKHYIFGGFEGELLFNLQKRLNFSLKITVPPNNEKRGKLTGYRYSGAIGMLIRREADLSLGAFRQNAERLSLLTSTVSYHQSQIVLSILTVDFTLRSAEVFVYPFYFDLWMLLFATILIFAFQHALLCKYKWKVEFKTSKVFFSLWAVMLGQNYHTTKNAKYSPFIMMIWLLYTLLIRSVYTSVLYRYLSPDFTNPLPKTLEQLHQNGYTFIMNDVTHEALTSVFQDERMSIMVINDSSDTIAVEYILTRHDSRKRAAVSPKDFLLYYMSRSNEADIIYRLPTNVLSIPMSIFLNKHSCFVNEFNKYLVTMISSGLFHHWRRNELKTLQNNEVHCETSHRDSVFNLQLLYFPFECFLLGMFIAICVFVYELKKHRYQRTKRNKLLKNKSQRRIKFKN